MKHGANTKKRMQISYTQDGSNLEKRNQVSHNERKKFSLCSE